MESATLHATAWLLAGNAVGLLLATLLLAPDAGRLLAPLTYGRWVPLHTGLLLYGWCALPLVALLLRIYAPRPAASWPGLAVAVWSGTLLFAAVAWLAGDSSGKAFLEWRGAARVLFALDLTLLAGLLLAALVRETARRLRRRAGGARWALAGKWALWLALAVVPPLLYWAASPEVHPPINPASGGPTGVSLMGSSLGIVAIVLLVPIAAGLRRRVAAHSISTPVVLLVAHLAWFLALDHGDHSHHEPLQIVALASLLIWFPLLRGFLRGFDWPDGCRRWLVALGGWGGALLATAIPTFLPGVLERWKFTNVLVGHAHLAMAGFVSSLLIVLLGALNRDTRLRGAFESRTAFRLWHAGNVAHVVALLALGSLEGASPGLLFRDAPVVAPLYLVRWIAGAAMLCASGLWLANGLRLLSRSEARRSRAAEEWHHAA